MARRSADDSAGFTLIEVLVALLVLVAVTVGVVQLFAISTVSTRASRDRSSAVLFAASRIEELKSLAWTFVGGSDPPIELTDLSTNLSVEPHASDGPGLSLSPPGTLTTNTPPYVDYLDANGVAVGGGDTAPRTAVFVRRWAVAPLPLDPTNALMLQVRVVTTAEASRGGTPVPMQDVLLTTVIVRKVR
jgi:prepilin-type N-terminal cleavage/methylation domain-containing protein